MSSKFDEITFVCANDEKVMVETKGALSLFSLIFLFFLSFRFLFSCGVSSLCQCHAGLWYGREQ